ncbi:hypothetical protein [Allohahella marinimesophila]
MNRLLLMFVLFTAAAVTATAFAQTSALPASTIVKVLTIEYPPFTSEAMPTQGTSFAMLRKRLEGSGIEIAPRFLPPARLQQTMDNEAWHASYVPQPNAAASTVRLVLQDANFIYGLFRVRESSAFEWTDLSELAGKQIAVTRSLKLEAYNAELVSKGAHLVFIDDISQGFRMLEHGRVDYVLAIQETGWYVMDTLKMKRQNYQFSDSAIDRFPYAIYINQSTLEGQALFRALTLK